MSNIIQPTITTIDAEGDRYENASLRHADGSKYGYTLYIEGQTDGGTEFTARAIVQIQSWTDINAEGQFVVTTDATVERFKSVSASAKPELYGFSNWGDYKANYDTLSADEQEIADAKSEADDAAAANAAEGFLDQVIYKPEYKHFRDAIKTAAFKAHLRLK
jgi:hypothetical protein